MWLERKAMRLRITHKRREGEEDAPEKNDKADGEEYQDALQGQL